jgi:hypothetical protein
VVVHNLPCAIDLAPHVGEASLNSLAGILGSDHESVHAGVEVGIVAVGLNVVGGDGAGGELLEESHEVLLGGLGVADELGGHSGEERQVGGRVEVGDLLELLGLEGVVPPEVSRKISAHVAVARENVGSTEKHPQLATLAGKT